MPPRFRETGLPSPTAKREGGSRRSATPKAKAEKTVAKRVLADDEEATLLDLVDNVLTRGVVLTGDVTIGLAHVDLVYARLSLLLCAADRIMPGEHPDPVQRLQDRVAARTRGRERRRSARTP
jgi:hypothetical protein